MRTNAKKRVLAWIMAAVMVVAYMPQMAFATTADDTTGTQETAIAVAAAEPITVLDGKVSISDSKGTGALANGVITITAPGVSLASEVLEPNVITITNNIEKPATVSFDYTAENYKEFSEEQAEGTFSAVLEAGESATVSITGKQAFSKNTAVLKMSNFALVQVEDESEVTFIYEDDLGSVNVNGSAVAAGSSVSAAYAEGMSFTAIPDSGSEFLGWINAETGRILSRELSMTYKPIDDISLEAVFVNETSGAYYLTGEKYILSDFAAAMEKAQSLAYPVVALMNDVTLPAGNYTVPYGVTLLVPFDDEYTLYKEAPLGVNGEYSTPVAYRTLTLASGATLDIYGEVSLSAKHNAANSSSRGSGAPYGDVSFIEMEKDSHIKVQDGGFLYVYGYIVGEGDVVAYSGSTIYENFQLEDFRGGSCTTYMAAKEEGEIQEGVLPISQYYIQNIEVPMELMYGATEYCYASVYMLQTVMGSAVKFIGNEEAMFTLKDGSATKVYDGSTDRLIVEGNGNMSLSSITVYLDTTPIIASMFELPINSNITVRVNDGNVDINQDVALLPGAEIVIEEGASCTLGEDVSVYVYDKDQWGGYCSPTNEKMFPINYAPGKQYNRTEADLVDASICVNGVLDASRGYLYTTRSDEDTIEGGGNIYSTENGVIKMYSGEDEYTYQFIQEGIKGEYVPIYVLPANLVNGDGEYVQTIDIDRSNPGTYTYNHGKWQCDHPVKNEVVVSEATCDTDGITTVTCGAAVGHTYDIVAPALGHSWDSGYIVDKDPTCTEAGSKSIHCLNCDAVKNAVEIEATGHSYTEFTTVTAAGCETEGSEKAVCDVCGEEYTQAIPALGHDMVYADETPATCTEKGSMSSGECSRCDHTVGAGEIPALGHNFKKYTDNGDATCETAGTETAACERCDATDTRETAALGHLFTKYTDDNNATCTEKGTETSTCDREGCQVKDVLETAALGHKWNNGYTVDEEAGCDTRGSKSIHCSVCDEINEESVKTIYAKGHEYGSWITVKDSTCTVAGTDERTCDICGHEDSRDKALIDHSWEDSFTVDKEATCTENGYKSYHCAVCGEQDEITSIPATGHAFGEYTDNGDAACETAGTKTALCEKCGAEDIQLVAPLGHDWQTTYTIDEPATCKEPGVQSIHCNRCDGTKNVLAIPVTEHSFTEFKNNTATCTAAGTATSVCDFGCGTVSTVEVEALGHSYGEWIVVKAATCTAEGSEERICDACGNKETSTISKANHNWETEYTVDVEPTCTTEGSRSLHCADCDMSRNVAVQSIPALKHDKIYHDGKAATCTEKGWNAYETCSRCDYTTYEEIGAKGHSHKAVVTAATCTEDGYTTYTCACGDSYVADKVDAKGHSHEAVVTEPTCTETGFTTYTCACGDSYIADNVDAKGHDYEAVVTAATCTEAGFATYTCACGVSYVADEVAAAGHKTKKTTVKATAKAAGSITSKCETCGVQLSKTTIAKIGKTTIPKTVYVYNGKAVKPVVTVKNVKGKKLVKGTDYTVVYKKAKGTKAVTPKAVGSYKAVVTFKGNYKGTVTKNFKINPKGTAITKLTKNGKRQFTVKWTKRTVQVTGYQIRYSTKKNMSNATVKTVKSYKTNVKTYKQLKAKKKYWVQVRTYKTVNGKKFYSAWSAKKTITTK